MTDAKVSVSGRAPQAMAWAAATMVASKGATLVATLVLARLLVPADFGLFAVGLLVINYLDRVKDVGVGAGLVYRREEWTRLAGTGLGLSVASSFLLSALAVLLAPLAGQFFGDDRAVGVVQLLAVALLVSGLAVVPESKLRRELDFRRRLVPEVAAAVVKGVVSVALAYAGQGVFSLVWGQVAGSTVQSLLYWKLCGWRPRFAWRGDDARALIRYGLPSALVAVLAVVTENLDYVVIGRLLPSADLGYYVLAYRVPELTVLAVCIVAGQVFFPMFSRLQDDIPELAATYLRSVRLISLITVPGGVLVAVVAPELVTTLYSDGWEPAIPVLRLLALFSAVYSLSFHAGEVYKATGRPGILNILAVVKLVVLLPPLWWAAHDGIVAVAAVMVAANVVLTLVKLAVVRRILGLTWSALGRAFVPAVGVSAVTAAAVAALSAIVPDWAGPIRLLLLCGAALPIALGAIAVLAPATLREVRAAAGSLRPRNGTGNR
jgi:lipopolysaccharide exporter